MYWKSFFGPIKLERLLTVDQKSQMSHEPIQNKKNGSCDEKEANTLESDINKLSVGKKLQHLNLQLSPLIETGS